MFAGSKVIVIADDLTGAADSAVAFAVRGCDTRIVLDVSHISRYVAEVLSVTIESRDAPEGELAQRNAILDEAMRSGRLCIRKIDSILRGNTLTEIVLLAKKFRDVPIVLAPAYPALGRVTSNGSVLWHDHSKEECIPLEKLLLQRGLRTQRVSRGEIQKLSSWIRSYEPGNPAVFLCDATEQQDLERLVAAGFAADRSILWMGSGGLAHALAAKAMPSEPRQRPTVTPRGKIVFVIGSDHPVTLRQIQHLRSTHTETPIIVPVTRAVTTPQEVRSAIQAIPAPEIGCLFMTGGDTAMLACRALGVESLLIEGEAAPGVPVTRMSGGALSGVTALLKSGSFGEDGLLSHISQHYRNEREDAA